MAYLLSTSLRPKGGVSFDLLHLISLCMTNNRGRSVELVNSITVLLREKCSLTSHVSVLLSVSAGQDSVCLLAIMRQMQAQWQSRVGTVSCNHLWQEDSFYSLFHVSRVCLLLNKSFYFVPVVLRDTGSNEGAARVWRHNIVQRVAGFYQYRAVWTGHTGSDRIETLLFNLMRGSGKKGLSSLYWSRFLTPCYPKMCHLSNFDGTSSAQKKRFLLLQGGANLSPRTKGKDFRQICMVSSSMVAIPTTKFLRKKIPKSQIKPHIHDLARGFSWSPHRKGLQHIDH